MANSHRIITFTRKEKSSFTMFISILALLAVSEWVWALLVGILATIVWLGRSGNQQPQDGPQTETPANLTIAFRSAIPTLTQELNLEVATAQHVETLVLEDASFWGTNRVEIQVPVTYRYHICLRDTWQLDAHGHTLTVAAPRLRAAQPPAIHTDQLQIREERGAFRFPPSDLREKALQQLTPQLSQQAEDERRLSLVRETARSAVKDFVRQWLMREGDWGHRIHSIELDFGVVPAALPSLPSLPERVIKHRHK